VGANGSSTDVPEEDTYDSFGAADEDDDGEDGGYLAVGDGVTL
jgi:hypothetical protein